MSQQESPKEKLVDLLKSFDEAMLVTRASDGELRSRPMRIVATKPSGEMVFVTGLDQVKVDEILAEPQVNVACHDGKRSVSVSAKATVSNDRERIGLYHDKSWDLWFPEGVNDPNIALIDVHPSTAEYWDGSGLNRLKFAAAAAGALMRGEAMDPDSTEHGTVKMK
ncbi:Pyridoxamine 5'-phosphate oxidase [Planctomycetes bacterium Poly30]|uniref:Pyridoxamine 5'-phosphate oxidase n=1 Tax=Saltatorellus ferox TaxID=2528018 RepID=A0A518EPS1_9BACT|nr:Pyridoxamine 5'-phosphate oxidase [Planctomycetes bacterium Poly30]